MAQLRYVLVDVFTDEPLTGNPLAVYTDARAIPEPQLQRIAAEMNLSETVFLLPAQADGDARVRIFTPRTELPFAGHPLIGAAWVYGRATQLGRLVFETGVGNVTLELEREGGMLSGATMRQPRPAFRPVDDRTELLQALGLPTTGFEPELEIGDNGVRSAFVPAGSLEALAELAPDGSRLARFGEADTACVWALEHDQVRARVFAPAVGVHEDPATGSAAGPLAAHLVRTGIRPPGRTVVRQGVEMGRPSTIDVDVSPDGDVDVGGACAVVGRGFLEL